MALLSRVMNFKAEAVINFDFQYLARLIDAAPRMPATIMPLVRTGQAPASSNPCSVCVYREERTVQKVCPCIP